MEKITKSSLRFKMFISLSVALCMVLLFREQYLEIVNKHFYFLPDTFATLIASLILFTISTVVTFSVITVGDYLRQSKAELEHQMAHSAQNSNAAPLSDKQQFLIGAVVVVSAICLVYFFFIPEYQKNYNKYVAKYGEPAGLLQNITLKSYLIIKPLALHLDEVIEPIVIKHNILSDNVWLTLMLKFDAGETLYVKDNQKIKISKKMGWVLSFDSFDNNKTGEHIFFRRVTSNDNR